MIPTPTPMHTISIGMFTSFPYILVPLLVLALIVLVIAWILLFAFGGRKPRQQPGYAASTPRSDLAPPPTQESIYTPPPASDESLPPVTPASLPQEQPAVGGRLIPTNPPTAPAPPEPAGDFGLHLLLPDGTTLNISRLPAIIGRSTDCDIRLDNDSVSNQHARLDYDRPLDSIIIEDLDSSNGTQVNGRPTRKNILRHDDRVSFGSLTVTFLDTGFLPPIG